MAYIKYYIDKPYALDISKESLKKLIGHHDKLGKPYPKNIFNPRPTAVYLFFTYESNQRIKAKTLFKTFARDWDFKNGKIKNKVEIAFDINLELQTLSTQILKNYSKAKQENDALTEAEVRLLVNSTIHKIAVTKDNSLKRATELFLEKKKGLLSEGTLKEYKTIFRSLFEYEQYLKKPLVFNDFNQSFFNSYEKYLISKKNPYARDRGLLNDTISKYCATLKTFLDWSYYEGFLKSKEAILKIKTQVKRKVKNDVVALTESELFQLLSLDLSSSPRLEKVRDVFCFACFTGQRFSDISRFDKNHFADNKWQFNSFKTKKKTVVPFEGFIANALPILEKYNYTFPVISNQKFNDYLKEVGELAEFNNNVRKLRYTGTKEVEFIQPKYEYMSSHMARRTFVTIMIEKGIPLTIIQKITQHSDIRTLVKYEGHSESSLIAAFKNT
jgi:integrase